MNSAIAYGIAALGTFLRRLNMGVVRIGVKTPRYIKASSSEEAEELALRFAQNEKGRVLGL